MWIFVGVTTRDWTHNLNPRGFWTVYCWNDGSLNLMSVFGNCMNVGLKGLKFLLIFYVSFKTFRILQLFDNNNKFATEIICTRDGGSESVEKITSFSSHFLKLVFYLSKCIVDGSVNRIEEWLGRKKTYLFFPSLSKARIK